MKTVHNALIAKSPEQYVQFVIILSTTYMKEFATSEITTLKGIMLIAIDNTGYYVNIKSNAKYQQLFVC